MKQKQNNHRNKKTNSTVKKPLNDKFIHFSSPICIKFVQYTKAFILNIQRLNKTVK